MLSRAWRNGSFNSSAVMIWWSYAVCTCTSTAGLKNRAEATLATCCAKYLRVVEDESITTASLPSSKDGALAIPTDGRFATRVCGARCALWRAVLAVFSDVSGYARLAPAARRGPRRRLALSSERAARSPTPLNPAGFEPRIPRVPNSGLLCRVCLSPMWTCTLVNVVVAFGFY